MNIARMRAMPFSPDHCLRCEDMFVPYGRSAVTCCGVGRTRLLMSRLASCQALNTLRGETFRSAFDSFCFSLVIGSTSCDSTVSVMATPMTYVVPETVFV